MVKDVSKSRGSERDLFRGWTSSLLLWGLPWFPFVLGYSLSPAWRTVLWTTSLAFLGVACLLNAFRCGRIHCLFTGPFSIPGALVSPGAGLALLPLGSSAWKWSRDVPVLAAM